MKRSIQNSMIFSEQQGFTLIELLMVVIILGILAAVAIPQFSASSKDAKLSALKSDLSTVRNALELYVVQHDGQYPTSSIKDQLTLFTDNDGNTSNTKTATYQYGPYIKHGFPKNPFVSDTLGDVVITDSSTATLGTITAEADPNGGWLYVTQTGEFIANHVDYDHF